MERSDVATHIAPRANVANPHLNGHPCGPSAFTDDYKVNGTNTRLALENRRSSSAGSGSLGDQGPIAAVTLQPVKNRAKRTDGTRPPLLTAECRGAEPARPASAWASLRCHGGVMARADVLFQRRRQGGRSVPRRRSCLLFTKRGSHHATRYFEECFGNELGPGDGHGCAC